MKKRRGTNWNLKGKRAADLYGFYADEEKEKF
jgi:hypothetical protein